MRTLKRGKTVYPVQLRAHKTPSGKTVTRYELDKKFQFVKTTKKKPKVESGTYKTRKGYILQKTHPDAKITITRSGEIVETLGRTRRRKTRYKQRDLLKLLDKFDKGEFKFKRNEMVSFHKFGAPHMTIDGKEAAMRFISNYIKDAEGKFDPATFQRFWEHSYLEFIEDTENDETLDLG